MTHQQTRGLLALGLPEPRACDDVACFPHALFSGQGNEARMPTPFRNILRQEDSLRMVLAQRLHGQETGRIRR